MFGVFYRNKGLVGSILVLIAYLSPLIIMGEDSYVLIHDNLDSTLIYFKALAESGHIFSPSDTLIQSIFNGLPRISLGSEFNLILWFYVLFPPYLAYLLNLTLIHIIAFIGMYHLLRRYFVDHDNDNSRLIQTGVALCFALLPFYPAGGLSVAGLPLALYALLNVRAQRDTFVDWLILCLLPFYSSLIFSFSFFLAGMGGLWCLDSLRGKTNYRFLFSIFWMFVIFLGVEYRLVLGMFFDSGFVSHRTEFFQQLYDLGRALRYGLKNFIHGHYHAHSLHGIIVWPVTLAGLGIAFFKAGRWRLILSLLTITFLISFWYGMWKWEGLAQLKEQVSLLRVYHFNRAHWLHPLLWYLLFALALVEFSRLGKFAKPFIMVVLIFQIGWLFSNSQYLTEYRNSGICFREFYATEQFEEIGRIIGKERDAYRVASLGIHPAIAAYNGFQTIDMYFTVYPLEYKHRFYRAISRELEKDEKLKSRFLDWGSRVYLFSHELGYDFLYDKRRVKKVYDLSVDTRAMRDLGCEYVFSSVEILNHDETGLEFIKLVKNPSSAWDIYLYKVVGS